MNDLLLTVQKTKFLERYHTTPHQMGRWSGSIVLYEDHHDYTVVYEIQPIRGAVAKFVCH